MRMILALLALLCLSRPMTAAPPESLLGARSVAAVLDPFQVEVKPGQTTVIRFTDADVAPETGKAVTTWECTATGCKAVAKVPYANQHGQYPAAGSVCFAPSAVQRTTTRVVTVEKRVVYRSAGGRERFRRDREGPLRRLFSRFRR